ncbi:MAG: phytoene desaturase family protein [Cytophagales bacterium]
MVDKKFDYIVIGGGINSLISAALLSKKNKSVLLFESCDQIGGMASLNEFSPGFKCNLIYDYIKWIDDRVIKNLKINKSLLEYIENDIYRISLNSNTNDHIFFNRDNNKTVKSIQSISKSDSEKWIDFTNYISKIASFLKPLYKITPPNIQKMGLGDAMSMKEMIKPMWSHGTRGFVDILRTLPMMMPELLDEWFESKLLRGTISASGIHHLNQGPYSAATVLNFLHHNLYSGSHILDANFIKGGVNNFSKVLKNKAIDNGAVIKINSKVISIDCSDDICHGVTLENGEKFFCNNIISGLDQNNTCIKLLGLENLNPNIRTQLNNIKYRGSTARIHFALKTIPKIKGVNNDQLKTVFSITPSINYLEKAFDEVKYGRFSSSPSIEFCIPSLINSGYAPNGKHVLSASIQYIPYKLKNKDWNKSLKDDIIKNVTNILDQYISNFSDIIIDSSISTPLDFENSLGITEGSFNHGDMTLDQFLFMRPTISSSQYRTHIKNLFICGPSTHPGGGLHGSNAFNMVNEILK